MPIARSEPLNAARALRHAAMLAGTAADAHACGLAHGSLLLAAADPAARPAPDSFALPADDAARAADVAAIAQVLLSDLGLRDERDAAALVRGMADAGVPPGARAIVTAALGPAADRPTAEELRDDLRAASAVAGRATPGGGSAAATGAALRLKWWTTELRRRRVPRTALLYVTACAATVEAADIFLPSLGAPDGVTRVLVILSVFGFPVVLALAWAFDIAPADAAADTRWGRWKRAVMVGTVAVTAAIAAVLVGLRGPVPAEDIPPTGDIVGDPAHVAILPFEVPDDDETLKRLAGALHTRLVDGLNMAVARVPRGPQRLTVVSRLHSLSLAGVGPDSLRRGLGVGTVMHGSVEARDGAVRVTLRLSDTNTGDQLATSSVEARNDVALFEGVADSVLHLIRRQLGLLVREQLRLLETNSTEAYAHFTQADRSLDAFQPALERDDYARAARSIAEADSLFAVAEKFDRQWIEPILARGRLSRQAHRLAVDRGDPEQTAPILTGIRHAERALALSRGDYRAHELRGDLRFLFLLVTSPSDDAEFQRLVRAAEQDLTAALVGNPTPALALRVLSEVAAADGRVDEALSRARQAYEEDPYLQEGHNALFRLFQHALAAGFDEEAAGWCAEGRGRYGGAIMFHECRLVLGAWTDSHTLAPDSAWSLVRTMLDGRSPSEVARLEPRLHVMTAAVLLRAGATDSALSLLRATEARHAVLPGGLLRSAAGAWALARMPDTAFSRLSVMVSREPSTRRTLDRSPELRLLRSDPRYAALRAGGQPNR